MQHTVYPTRVVAVLFRSTRWQYRLFLSTLQPSETDDGFFCVLAAAL